MDDLEKLARRITKSADNHAELIRQRDNAIRAELDKPGGRGPTELAQLFELTRGRIHQINRDR